MILISILILAGAIAFTIWWTIYLEPEDSTGPK